MTISIDINDVDTPPFLKSIYTAVSSGEDVPASPIEELKTFLGDYCGGEALPTLVLESDLQESILSDESVLVALDADDDLMLIDNQRLAHARKCFDELITGITGGFEHIEAAGSLQIDLTQRDGKCVSVIFLVWPISAGAYLEYADAAVQKESPGFLGVEGYIDIDDLVSFSDAEILNLWQY